MMVFMIPFADTWIRPYTDKMVDAFYGGNAHGKIFSKAVAPYVVLSGLTLSTATLVVCLAPSVMFIPVCLVAVVVLAKFSWTILSDRTFLNGMGLQRELKELCFATPIRNLIGVPVSQERLEKFIDSLKKTQIEVLAQKLLTWMPIVQGQDAEQRIARRVFCDVMYGERPFVSFLCAAQVDCALFSHLNRLKDENHETVLMRAACDGDEELVQLLLNTGADPKEQDLQGRTAFHHAISFHWGSYGSPHVKCVKKLLSMGANENSQYEGRSIISCGALTHKTEIVEALLDAGVDLGVKDSKDGMTAFMHVAYSINLKMMRVLLEKCAHLKDRERCVLLSDRDCHGKTALMYSVQKRPYQEICYIRDEWIEQTKALLAAGASHKTRDFEGKSALMYTIEDLKMTQALLEAGASPADHDFNHKTAFMWAVTHGTPEVVIELGKVCMRQGHATFLNDQTRDGMTPLMMAIQRDHTRIVADLMEMGANKTHIVGQKPILRYALEQRSWKTVLLLVLIGQSLIEAEEDGQTIFDYLIKSYLPIDTYKDMLQILKYLIDMERQGKNVSHYLSQFMRKRNIHDVAVLQTCLLREIFNQNAIIQWNEDRCHSFFETLNHRSRVNFLKLLQNGKEEYHLNRETIAYLNCLCQLGVAGGVGYLPAYTSLFLGKKFTTVVEWEQFLNEQWIFGRLEKECLTEAALYAAAITQGIPRDLGVLSHDVELNRCIHLMQLIRKMETTTNKADLERIQGQILVFYQDLRRPPCREESIE